MGFFKKIKKIIKKPEAMAGIIAAPITGGVSLALVGDAAYRQKQAESYEKRGYKAGAAAAEGILTKERYGYDSMADLVAARKRKQQQLNEQEGTRATGISSLVGRGSTLG